jgi:hypothetical protein
MDAQRQKALDKAAQMLRLARDERSPAGERQAARSRIHALCRRHGFLGDEVEAALDAQLAADTPQPRQPPPAPVFGFGNAFATFGNAAPMAGRVRVQREGNTTTFEFFC